MVSDAALLHADQAARAAALDASRSFIVQAPAGSGKTELLIQRYLGLLATVDNPEEVLAITFTLKAAAEMRVRVVNALLRVELGDAADLPHQKVTLEAAGRVLARDRKLDWRLLQSPRRMRIQTLDAFCAGIARSLPVSSGLGQIGRTVVDTEMHSLHRTAAASSLDWLQNKNGSMSDVERVLRHLDNNTSLYINYVSRMLAARDQWLSIVGGETPDGTESARARQRIEASIERLIVGQLRLIREQIPQDCARELLELITFAADNLARGENPEHPLAQLRNIGELPGTGVQSLAAWRSIASLLLVKNGSWRRSVTKREGFPAATKEEKIRLYGLIAALSNSRGLRRLLDRSRLLPPVSYSDEQWSVLLALFGVLRIAVSELRQLFDARGLSDHTEVAIAADAALGTIERPGEIALMLDYSIRHLLIDEMQDTSVGQYQLIERLTAGWEPGDGRTLFCVGDPMQSIYRFRDADVSRFNQARKSGVGSVTLESLTLRQNFRAGEHLVHWLNTVFSQVMSDADDDTCGAIGYSDSVPAEMHQGTGDCYIHPLIDASPDFEAETSLQLLRDCVQRFPEDSKAILVRSRTHLVSLLAKLRGAGIAYRAIEIDRLTDLPEIIDVLALTRALCHAADRLAWLALLRGPWVGLTWQDLHSLVKNDKTSTIVELMTDPSRLQLLSEDGHRRAKRFIATITPRLESDGVHSLRDRLEAAWFHLGGAALLQDQGQVENVYRYFDVVDGLATADTLVDIGELEKQLDGERVSTIAEATNELQVMTMHKAKGLEFDHVFLPGLGRVPRARQKPLLNWLSVSNPDTGDTLIVSPVGARAELEHDALHQYIEEVEKEKDKFELQRLLYVACTRAKKSLHLIANVRRSRDGETLRPPDPGTLLHWLWPVVSDEFNKVLAGETQPAVSIETSQSGLIEPQLKRLRQPWSVPDLAPLPGAGASQHVDSQLRAVDYYWVGSAARHAGTIIHRWMQRMTRPGLLMSTAEIENLRPVNESWAQQLGVPKDQVGDVCERVTQALHNTIADERGRWLLDGNGHAEFAATGLRDGSLQSIVIDRVRIEEDGTHWIVDYKSSTHEGGDLPGFLRQESDRYREQLTAYREIYSQLVSAPVRTALYFPLLQCFREIEISA